MTEEQRIRLFDMTLAAGATIALSPLMLAVAAGSALFVGWPPLFFSERIGRGGRSFRHIKFKSMLPGSERGRVFFEDDRLNTYGRMIRSMHLDELPELVHILRGEMSFVGPRPLPRRLLDGLDVGPRHTVRPGWTGPAQCWLAEYGRLDKQRQIELDLAYVQTRSLWLNLRILAQTLTILGKKQRPLDMSTTATADRRAFARSL